MIELKEYGRGQSLVERVIEVVERLDMSQQVVVMSLSVPLVRETKRLRPDWTVGVLSAVAVGRLAELEADFLAISGKTATRSLLGQARQRKKPVYVWTIDSESAMLHYLSLGVDGIITNRPDAAQRTSQFYQELGMAERLLLEASLRLGIVPFQPPG
jgi:glycerophosphoryl diester phosphodiesterase